MKARIKEPVGVTLQVQWKMLCVWQDGGIKLKIAISVKIKGPRKALKPTMEKKYSWVIP